MMSMLARHIRTLAKRVVPHRVVFLVRRYTSGADDLRGAGNRERYRDHGDVPERTADGVDEVYGEFLGGGVEGWDARARAQASVAVELGLEPHHRMLEIGCGPGRATPRFAEALEPNRLVAFDQRPDFIEAARASLEQHGVEPDSVRLEVVEAFDLRGLGVFDFAIAWSVLNHCTWGERADFFERIVDHLAPRGRLVVTHGAWATTPWFLDWLEDVIARRGLRVVRRIDSPAEIESAEVSAGSVPMWVFERS